MSTHLRQRDAGANDSDKTFTVPASQSWHVHWIQVLLVTTATVGNRQLRIDISDGTNAILSLRAGLVHAASTTRNYVVIPGVPRETTAVDGSVNISMPTHLRLLPGWTLRVYDSAAIDAAADDMTVSFGYDVPSDRIEI